VIWAVYGYSLAFGGNGGDRDFGSPSLARRQRAQRGLAGTIPHQTFMVYH